MIVDDSCGSMDKPFILLAHHREEIRTAWWEGFVAGIALIFATFLIAFGILAIISPVHAQTVPTTTPLPSSYTFTFTPENTDNLYAALERASQAQALVTGDRSPRFDALEAQIRTDVLAQKAAAQKVAEKPKDEPANHQTQADDPKAEAKP